jgi:pimeloyl-ACP methyl ester carboxylesterase
LEGFQRATDRPNLQPELEKTKAVAVICSDGADLRSWTRNDHWKKWKELELQSSTFGGRWSELTMPCSSWDIRPSWNFNASISAPNTSHPILWLSNTRDPVTPLRNARRMATKFPGSVVYGQDADGHATLVRPSRCVMKGVREYFQSGKLPEGDISCKPDHGPFDSDEEVKGLSADDLRLSETSKMLANTLRPGRFPLGF